jgi:acyl-coenzyme A thioesterase PaaI-like protein
MTGRAEGLTGERGRGDFTLTLEELGATFSADRAASGVAADDVGDPFEIVEYTRERIVGRTHTTPEHSRKGGTIAGMTIFRFFDSMAYVVTLAQSPRGTEAYTSDVTIQFLRPGPLGPFDIEARPLRFGRRASVVGLTLSSPLVEDGPVATGVVTYAPVFPSARGGK